MEKENINKRTAILKAAMELIATKACVGTGTIYRYFTDKNVLIKEVYLDVENRLHQSLLEEYQADQSVRRRLVIIIPA